MSEQNILPTGQLSNVMADLAEQVKETVLASKDAHRQSIEKAIDAGYQLVRAKSCCQHGEWLPFLERAGVHERQAQRLMKLAQACLKPDTVSDLGGIKAALEYASLRRLPPVGYVLFVSPKDKSPLKDGLNVAWIEHDQENAGCYKVNAIRGESDVVGNGKPLPGKLQQFSDGRFFHSVWACLDVATNIPPEDREFCMMPAELADMADDFPEFEQLTTNPLPEWENIETVPLPRSYLRVLDRLKECEKDLTLKNYERLQWALNGCVYRSEKWPSHPAMLKTYSRIANDRTSDRVEHLSVRALLKFGKVQPEGNA
ncbi:DUF3102 domain-containing protein [Brucella anthropi]|uniref:DUF3102 domain-containing protein n=1 Tax=Brucella anthropi TaxID=529 RepID=UPI000CFD1BDD|nr:DUF3102 domain-containing protein [Ochrobactrum sp. MYb49]PQZ62724.1 hypothetical protein CQ057_14860 [Ochrobactrum sp. MYb49]